MYLSCGLNNISLIVLKPLDTFWTDQKVKVYRFTNNLQGLQKVMVKDFPWNIVSWKALLFEKTLKQLSILDIEINRFSLNTCHDTAKRAETMLGFPDIFSQLRWPIEPKFLQVVVLYTSCDTLSVGLWTILFNQFNSIQLFIVTHINTYTVKFTSACESKNIKKYKNYKKYRKPLNHIGIQ